MASPTVGFPGNGNQQSLQFAGMDSLQWLVEHRGLLFWITCVLIVLVGLQRLGLRWRRQSGAAPLHPRLQAYAGRSEADLEADRRDAGRIVATSSTGNVAGYEVVRQLEATFVEGYRTPGEAALALKAAAARQGANALIHLSQQRMASGRCTAQGDAVLIRPVVPEERRTQD